MMEHKCPKCGKIFIPAAQHRYKIGDTYWCKWTCYLHRDDNENTSRARKIEVYDEWGDLLRTFNSAKEVDEQLGYPEHGVMDACRLGTKYKGFYWRYKEKANE